MPTNTPRAITTIQVGSAIGFNQWPNFTISFWAMANSDVDTNGDGIADAKSGGQTNTRDYFRNLMGGFR